MAGLAGGVAALPRRWPGNRFRRQWSRFSSQTSLSPPRWAYARSFP